MDLTELGSNLDGRRRCTRRGGENVQRERETTAARARSESNATAASSNDVRQQRTHPVPRLGGKMRCTAEHNAAPTLLNDCALEPICGLASRCTASCTAEGMHITWRCCMRARLFDKFDRHGCCRCWGLGLGLGFWWLARRRRNSGRPRPHAQGKGRREKYTSHTAHRSLGHRYFASAAFG